MIPQHHRATPPFHLDGCTCLDCCPASPADFPTTIDRAVIGIALLGVFFVAVTILRMIVPHVLVAIGAR